jgi:two-component system phosphate regulon sensor histidine kinase PhoR
VINDEAWRWELRFAVAAITTGLCLGWLGGSITVGLAAGLLLIIAHWAYRLYAVHRWLQDPTVEPPIAPGFWGRLLDSIYTSQRQNRRAQHQLETALDYLQDSLSATRDAAIISDQRGNIAWSNESARFLLGIEFPQDRGQALLNLIRFPAFQSYFEGLDYQAPLRIPPGADSERCLQFEITRFGAGDRLIFVRDITETFRLEQMRRDFVGNVSHELRTPLTVIKGYIDTLSALDELQPARLHRPLEQMNEQTLRMENLLTELLWLSRIESVESLRKTETVNVSSLLQEIVAEINAAYPDRDLVTQITSELAIRGERRELHSAFTNLIVNAIKYSEQEVTIVWQQVADRLCFVVKDRGPGIAPHHIPRLTERFYRVDKSRSAAAGGTGLGLAIVKHVANSHEASLDINSVSGEGSQFTLSFPLIEAEED